MRKLSLQINEFDDEGNQISKKMYEMKAKYDPKRMSLKDDSFVKLMNKFLTIQNNFILKEPEIDTDKQHQRIVSISLATAGFLAIYASIWSIVLMSKFSLPTIKINHNGHYLTSNEYTGWTWLTAVHNIIDQQFDITPWLYSKAF